MITISVITCTYNASSTIERTLLSVLGQDYPHVEHLIIDGKSPDSTCDLVKEYIAQSATRGNQHEVKLVSEPDRGLYDAMNKGLRLAQGDYLVFLNAGDTFPDTSTLSHIAQCAGGNPAPGVIYGDTDIVDDQGNFLCHRRLSPPEELSWKSFRHGMLVCHQAFYANTSIARAIPYNISLRYSVDVDWCIRVMKASAEKSLPLKNAHRVVAHFLDGGMTTANHRASLRERFRVMVLHYGLLSTIAMHCWFVVRRFRG